jgi:hypothetical protein
MNPLVSSLINFFISYAEGFVTFAFFFILLGWSIKQQLQGYLIGSILQGSFVFMSKLLDFPQGFILLTVLIFQLIVIVFLANKRNWRLFLVFIIGFFIIAAIEQIVAVSYLSVLQLELKELRQQGIHFYCASAIMLFAKIGLLFIVNKFHIRIFHYER